MWDVGININIRYTSSIPHYMISTLVFIYHACRVNQMMKIWLLIFHLREKISCFWQSHTLKSCKLFRVLLMFSRRKLKILNHFVKNTQKHFSYDFKYKVLFIIVLKHGFCNFSSPCFRIFVTCIRDSLHSNFNSYDTDEI